MDPPVARDQRDIRRRNRFHGVDASACLAPWPLSPGFAHAAGAKEPHSRTPCHKLPRWDGAEVTLTPNISIKIAV